MARKLFALSGNTVQALVAIIFGILATLLGAFTLYQAERMQALWRRLSSNTRDDREGSSSRTNSVSQPSEQRTYQEGTLAPI